MKFLHLVFCGLSLVACLLVIGCKVTQKPVLFESLPAARAGRMESASTLPDTLRGCQWTWDGLPGEEVTFEVWASVDLVQWQLATNTTERIALFPQKQMEFYRVRSRDALGSVSEWATVVK